VAVLKQLDKLVGQGAIVTGPAPVATVGLIDLRENLGEWNGLVKKLWNDSTVHHVRQSQTLDRLLAEDAHVRPDFAFTSAAQEARVEFIHRRDGETDAYFLTNQTGKPVVITADFRAGRRQPELWDADTATMTKAIAFDANEGRVRLPISLDAAGSLFVVFREPLADSWVTSVTRQGGAPVVNAASIAGDGQSFVADNAGSYVVRRSDGREQTLSVNAPAAPLEVTGPWHVTFQERRGAPASIDLDRLISLSTHADPGVKYFSGTATYTAKASVPPKSLADDVVATLDLGAVRDVAEVTINGQRVGIVWKTPFTADVTKYLKPGENEIVIAVTNTWVNRMIGDEQIPPDVKYATDGSKFTLGRLAEFPAWFNDPEAVRNRKRIAFPMWKHYEKDSPLTESGLLGPVHLKFARIAEIPR
jgi:hypothetical protein